MDQHSLADSLKKTRIFLLEMIKDLSPEQLNKTPAGFNNNIVWNLGHLIASQQGICYQRSGLQPTVEEKYIQPYKSGTKPGEYIDGVEVASMKETLLSSIDQTQKDLQNNLFVNYNTWTTRGGIPLVCIQDALEFVLYHEGLHSGYVMAMRKIVGNG